MAKRTGSATGKKRAGKIKQQDPGVNSSSSSEGTAPGSSVSREGEKKSQSTANEVQTEPAVSQSQAAVLTSQTTSDTVESRIIYTSILVICVSLLIFLLKGLIFPLNCHDEETVIKWAKEWDVDPQTLRSFNSRHNFASRRWGCQKRVMFVLSKGLYKLEEGFASYVPAWVPGLRVDMKKYRAMVEIDGAFSTHFPAELDWVASMHWDRRRIRIFALLQQVKDTTYESPPEGWQTFSEFVSHHPAWKRGAESAAAAAADSKPFVFHRDSPYPIPEAGRVEYDGTSSSFNAIVMLHYYLMAKNNNGVPLGMIDATQFILKKSPTRHLRNIYSLPEHPYLSDHCGSFRQLLLPNASLEDELAVVTPADLLAHGPALLSLQAFRVLRDGPHVGQSSFDTADIPTDYEREKTKYWRKAVYLLLIGVRTDEVTGKTWYLLQGWWKSQQYLEVSAEFMRGAIKMKPTLWKVNASEVRDSASVFSAVLGAHRFAETISVDSAPLGGFCTSWWVG